MAEHIPKRSRLSVDEVLLEMDDEVDQPIATGSDDEFDDMVCDEKERDDDEFTVSLPLHSPLAASPSPLSSPQLPSPTPCTPSSTPQRAPAPIPSSSPGTPSPTTPARATSSTWSSKLTQVDIPPFTQSVGPTTAIPTSPLEAFKLLFTDEICSFVVWQSNLYAKQVLGEEYSRWEPITTTELWAYFGFMILMGLYPKPALSDYWRRDPFVNYAPIADRIPRDRFYDVTLHFADNSTLPSPGERGHDRLGKVREVMDLLSERFLALYNPHCENSIDEAMIPFQGRSSLKQYMPAKPVKRGIKVWCRADAHNGYLCEYQVYTGRSERVDAGLGKRVVLDLSRRLQGQKYHLYFDNFFSSVSLLETLLDNGLYACGTARQSYKDFPAALKMKGKGKAEMRHHGLNNRCVHVRVCVCVCVHCTCTTSMCVCAHITYAL